MRFSFAALLLIGCIQDPTPGDECVVHLDCPVTDWCTEGVCTPRDARVPGDWETLDQEPPRDMAVALDRAVVVDRAVPLDMALVDQQVPVDAAERLDADIRDRYVPPPRPRPPPARGLKVACDSPVMAALVDRQIDRWQLGARPGTTCRAWTPQPQLREGTQVFFLTEAGTVDQVRMVDDQNEAKAHLRISLPPPRDVESDEYEATAGFWRDGFNPRDGLVRVVAVTRGEEDFTDTDGDGVYTVGIDVFEPEHDLPEPFIDHNDNGRWDWEEEFRDANNDGLWTPANGAWDGVTEIWTSTTVLWVGARFHCDMPRWADHPDCGCEGVNPRRDCSDNVGTRQRNEPAIRSACLEGCRQVGGECAGADVEVIHGETARIRISANFTDINGNCLGAPLPEDEAPTWQLIDTPPLEVIGPVEGTLDQLCFSAVEQPLNQAIEVQLEMDAPVEVVTWAEPAIRIRYATIEDEAPIEHEVRFSICAAPP